jgi:hypothetical protein
MIAVSTPEHADPNVASAGLSRPILFCDTETDGMTSPWLPTGRRIWEVAAIRRDPSGSERQFHGFIQLDELGFESDDPGDTRKRSLDIGGFYQRHPQIIGDPDPASHPDVYSYSVPAELLTDLLGDRPTLVGAVPSFDAESFLHLLHYAGLLTNEQVNSPWADRLVCVWALAAGRLGIPAHTLDRELMRDELGVDPSHYAHHTALDDTRWVKDVYDTLIST